jgi:Na+/H+ antiporter NhaD/arsenite permease-like protein
MQITLLLIFVFGYLFIVSETAIHINKTATALFTGVMCWLTFVLMDTDAHAVSELSHHLGSVSEILFFLLGAMTIVELVDAHEGFDVITNKITTSKKVTVLWIISFLAFFLSAFLDNLTTAIVMVTLLRKICANQNERLLFVGMVVIAANAGGAWSPIGDVTTTMLWIGGQISAQNIVLKLFLPSLFCMLTPLVFLSLKLKGNVQGVVKSSDTAVSQTSVSERNLVFFTALGLLSFVPIFKTLTGMPPYMGILFGLSILWIVTELLHKSKGNEYKEHYSVARALQRIDVPSILFFLGILLAISCLESAGILNKMAQSINVVTESKSVIAISIGLLSALVDNVPLVAASMGMYTFPMDDFFWEFIAYCAGTGGSILIIGSAAGVAAMGMEKINFTWYLKKIGGLALIGYFAGALVYLLMESVIH